MWRKLVAIHPNMESRLNDLNLITLQKTDFDKGDYLKLH